MATFVLTPEITASVLAGAREITVPDGAPAAAAVALATPAASAAAAEPTTLTAPAVTAPAPSTDLVAYLTGQVTAKESELLAANVKLAEATAAAAAANESVPGLLAIAQTVIGSMQVALGGSDTSKALGAKDAVAEHAKLAPVYAEKFKVGGIAVQAAAVDEPKQPHPAFAQRLAALGANRK